jgi:acyl-CoA-binding protein
MCWLRMTLFETKAPQVMNDLMRDFPQVGVYDAAAILGNIGHECIGFTDLTENAPGSPGYGWMQWTGIRRDHYEAWCAEKGLDKASDEANYGFLVEELRDPQVSRDAIAKMIVAEKTATRTRLMNKLVVFEENFVRAGVKAYDSRYRYAKAALYAHTPPSWWQWLFWRP